MILRRVISHVKNQEWTAIFLDFVIVVTGVFVGLQVNNWNEAQADSRRGAEFTDRLREDMREEAWSYAFLLAYNNEVLTNAERAADALEGRAAISDEELLISAYRATQYRDHRRNSATYQELTSTGSMGLIHDDSLRDTAMRLYTIRLFEYISDEALESPYREAFRMSLPYEVQEALGRNCGDRTIQIGDFSNISNRLEYPCSTGLEPDEVADAVQQLRAQTTLIPTLRKRIADLKTRIANLTVTNPDLLEGLRRIAPEMP